MTTNTNTAGAESAAIRHVRDSFLADIAHHDQMIRQHTEAAAQLRADNAIDAVHAEVAAALVANNVLIGGMPRQGKTASPRLLATLAALHGAEFDLAAAYACPDCGHLPGCGCDCCPYPMPAFAELQNGGA